jgi:hypothetical protein
MHNFLNYNSYKASSFSIFLKIAESITLSVRKAEIFRLPSVTIEEILLALVFNCVKSYSNFLIFL